VLDRVDGRLRGPAVKTNSKVAETAAPALTALLTNKALPIRISAAKAIERLQIRSAAAALLAAVKRDAAPDMRVEALKALVTLQDERLEPAIKHALADKEKKVRVAGLDLLEKMNIQKDVMVSLLTDVINTKTMEEQQAAVLTLGRLPLANSGKTLETLLNKMEAGQLKPDIYLELGEAIDSSRSEPLISRYKTISGKLSPDDLMASYAGSLQGGDPQRGRQIFYRNQNAQCMKCHAYDDRGGNAGPRLNGIAGRISREQILESLIAPGNRLAPGFGMVTLELKDGKKITGVLQGESKAGITIKEGLDPEKTIAAANIVKKNYAPSSMPDMKAILSKKEIRDVVSFLAESKTDD
jgi:putative heme-binding domain-containing protein